MAKSVFILSTLTADQRYTAYGSGGGDLPVVIAEVFVKGGANVADRRLITPYGVVTEISADDLSLLEQNEVFQLHKANGFITISDSRPMDADAAAASQNSRDGSAPLVEQDYEEGKAPTVSIVEDDGPQGAVPAAPRAGKGRA